MMHHQTLYVILALLLANVYNSRSFMASSYSRGMHTTQSILSVIMMTAGEPLILEGLPLVLERRGRPAPIQFMRRKMQLPFAVLLMRSSYQAVDKLNFVPTDEFQKSFFLFRQSEWEDYKKSFPALMQGDLTDPLYFDHVSFAQYAVISDKMRRGKQSYVQLIDANGTAESVQRAPLLENNDLLPAAHARLVGDAILDFIVETYGATRPSVIPAGLPYSNNTAAFKAKMRGSPMPLPDFITAAQDVLDTLLINSYALNIKVEGPLPEKLPNQGSMLMSVRAVGPANLWGSQVLRMRKDVVNDFEMKVLDRLADRFNLNLKVLSAVSNSADTTYVCSVSRQFTL